MSLPGDYSGKPHRGGTDPVIYAHPAGSYPYDGSHLIRKGDMNLDPDFC